MALSSWTETQILAQLNSGAKWQGDTITYSFPGLSTGLYTASGEAPGFRAFADAEKPTARLALQLWDDLIAPDMSEVAGGSVWSSSNIELAFSTTAVSYAHAYFPSVGSVWFNSAYDATSGGNNLVTPTVGRHGFVSTVHEIGHALGLEHMGEYNGSATSGPSSFQDSTVYSVMSYYGPSWGSGSANGEGLVAWADWIGADGRLYSPQTPMVNDIMAIQSIYGVETTTRTGDTIYGFNSNVTGAAAAIFNFANNKNPILTIFDSAGVDTLDLSGFATASSIDLSAGGASSAASMTLNIWIARTAAIENAVGGSGADNIAGNDLDNVLTGNAGNDNLFGLGGNDTLIGNAGSDHIDGGFGTDLVILDSVWSAMTVIYDSATATFAISGTDWTDTIVNVESFSDSSHVILTSADLLAGTPPSPPPPPPPQTITIVGTAAGNTLYGAGADDIILGLGGNDILYGRDGSDVLDGGTGRDRMYGDGGNDLYVVDNISDVVGESGNNGIDTVRTTLASLTLAVNVENLEYAGTASFRGTGNALANVIHGGNGADILDGGLGSDALYGGNGRDIFLFKSALGPSNVDTIFDFNVADDTVRLENAIFKGLPKTGALAATAFATGSGALDASDRIIFDDHTGALYYDADGTGAAAQVHFATLTNVTATLTAADFVVI